MLHNPDLIVVGGGAAGMFASVCAAQRGCKVLLLEKNDRPGKKLLITGKGRCNVTNNCSAQDVLKNIPRNARFLYSAMSACPPERVMAFFEENGCPLKTERGERVFPVSDRSADILAALQRAMQRAGVERRQACVTEVLTDSGAVCGVKAGRECIRAKTVLLCTGGASYPLTGSTGDGYRFAAQLGHTVLPPHGSLVPLECEGGDCAELQGLSLRNTLLRLTDSRGKTLFSEQGELLFTHFGLSGPTVLSASAHLREGERHTIVLDLKPALDEQTLDARFLRDFEKYANRSMENAVADLYPQSLIPVILRRAGIDAHLKAHSLTRPLRRALLEQTKYFSLSVRAPRPVEEAIVTRGGVDVREIDPKTMRSRRLTGLYFAGELLDCDAYTGGFNLQIAWASAYCAALDIAKFCVGQEKIL